MAANSIKAVRGPPEMSGVHSASGRQVTLSLAARPRGIHLITSEIQSALATLMLPEQGSVHIFWQHSSAGLLITENADSDVRLDLMDWLDRLAPAGLPHYRHVCEGPDDLPAHLISVLTGVSLWVPLRQRRLALGTWQGIALCEPRQYGGARQVLLTVLPVVA